MSLEPSNGKALLLTTSTEVSIAPKTRSAQTNGVTPKGNGIPVKNAPPTSSQPSKPEKDLTYKSLIFRVLPKLTLPPVSPICSALDDGSVTAIVFVSRMDLRHMSQLHLSEFCDIVDGGKCWNATAHRLAPPEDPNQTGGATSKPAPAPRVLVPNDGKTPAQTAPTPPTDEVLLAWSPNVPLEDGSVLVYGSLPEVEGYDKIRISMRDVSKHQVQYETARSGPSTPQ